jgi:hypothetical protein
MKIKVSAPVGLCVSRYDPSNSTLYVASAENPPDAESTKVYVLSATSLNVVRSVTIRHMGHITDMAEDPDSGLLGVVGFQMLRIPSEPEFQGTTLLEQAPFYEARFARIPYDSNGPVEAVCPAGASGNGEIMTLPLSIVSIGPKKDAAGPLATQAKRRK